MDRIFNFIKAIFYIIAGIFLLAMIIPVEVVREIARQIREKGRRHE